MIMGWTHDHSWNLAAPPDRVFAALTDPARLTRWFTEHADLGGGLGGRYRFWGRHTLGCPTPEDARQTITRFESGKALGFRWPLYGCETEVSITVAAEGEGSRLALRHRIDGQLPMPRARELIDDHWRLAFGNLAAHLAGGTGILLPDYADPSPEIRLTVMIEAPREAVSRALIEPALINQWFGTGSSVVDPRPGGRYDLGWKHQVDGKDVTGGPTRILEIIPNQKLVLDWPDWRGDATVGSATRVTFVHAGFGRATDMSDYPFGWGYFLGKLGDLMSGRPPEPAGPAPATAS
jgi:uncharacterized protein YndB with AHSA1/START domain